jgi:peptidoglycan/LPS O-acetylase OafA/YrhL
MIETLRRRFAEFLKTPKDVRTQSGLDRSWLPELDSLRFFAFLLVFGFHKGLPGLGGTIRDIFAMTIDLPWLLIFGTGGFGGQIGRSIDYALQQNGWIGVNVFFVLSGFIIARLLIQEERRTGGIDWKAFWIRRILRIWPLYYVIFLIGCLGIPGARHLIPGIGLLSPHAPWFAAFLGNWSMVRQGPVGNDILSVLWSVCVEEQFYVIIPIVMAVLGLRGRMAFCMAGVCIAVWRRHELASAGVKQYMITYDSFAQMDSILVGVTLAIVTNMPQQRVWLEWATRRIFCWVVGPLTVIAMTTSHLSHSVAVRRVWDPVLVWALAAMWVLTAAIATPRWSRFLRWPAFVYLGKISYGLYMWHEVLLSIMGSGIVTLLAVILTAMVSYRYIERPILKFKSRWSRVESRPV